MAVHNNDLNQVTWEQRVLAGDRRFEASQDLPDVSYARIADERLGGGGEGKRQGSGDNGQFQLHRVSFKND